jgi:hypothetical protein
VPVAHESAEQDVLSGALWKRPSGLQKLQVEHGVLGVACVCPLANLFEVGEQVGSGSGAEGFRISVHATSNIDTAGGCAGSGQPASTSVMAVTYRAIWLPSASWVGLTSVSTSPANEGCARSARSKATACSKPTPES